MPSDVVVGPVNSFLSRVTHSMYWSRAVALVRIFERTPMVSSYVRFFISWFEDGILWSEIPYPSWPAFRVHGEPRDPLCGR